MTDFDFATRIQFAAYNERVTNTKGTIVGQLLILVLFSILLLPVRSYLMDRDYRRIRLYLKERNLEALDIIWRPNNPFTSRSRGGSYVVKYVNAKNELFQARCYVENHAMLYWTEPTFLYAATPERVDRLRRLGKRVPDEEFYEAKTEKEKVIDGITSVFKYERIWAVRELLQMEHIDEQMVQLLETIALRDEEQEVREAATEVLNQLHAFEEG